MLVDSKTVMCLSPVSSHTCGVWQPGRRHWRGGLVYSKGLGLRPQLKRARGASVCVGGFITLIARQPGAVDSHESGDLYRGERWVCLVVG